MTAPRIISAAEARALLEAATPGPWSSLPLTADRVGPDLVVRVRMREGDSDLCAAAPDLAASVVALHEEIKRLRRLTRRQFDDVLDECQEEVKSPSEDLAYADGTVTDRAFTRPVWDMMEEEP